MNADDIWAYIIIAVYFLALLLIFFYSIAQLNLLLSYLRFRSKNKSGPLPELKNTAQAPLVTIQLPVFNELYVIERLLDNIALMDYPKDKLQIQVLDDSTDESIEKTAAKIDDLKNEGLDIVHIRRNNREGFKAGALKEGLKSAKGELIAIFDADFLPQPNWLRQTVPFFDDPKTGVVQTRWGHLNRDYSLLTKIQAFALDAHFTIEQGGRNAEGHFINFNGTAGIWRKACILDAGNWEADTLTEDLDLSYRAQLKHWKFKYLEHVETPAELPVVMSAARSQQFRWNKGGAENFKKTFTQLLKAKDLPLKTKIHGILHLLSSSMFLCAFVVAVLSIPVLYIKHLVPGLGWLFTLFSFFLVSTVILFICYWFTFKNIQGGGTEKFMDYTKLFFSFFSVVLGFSLHNTIAVIEGHLGKKSDFIRTPKFNIQNIKDSWKGNRYLTQKISANIILETILALYFLFGMYSAITLNDYGLFPFHGMLVFGFGFVLYNSLSSKA